MHRVRMSSCGLPSVSWQIALVGLSSLLSLVVAAALALPASAQTIRASVSTASAEGNARSSGAALSADGRYVAFASIASTLVPGDTNGREDVFVRDLITGQTSRVSVATGGGQAGGASTEPAISADGRYVAFLSQASNLVAGDTNGLIDVFVHDRTTDTTTRVSVTSAGAQATGGFNGAWFTPALSADGRYVAFVGAFETLVDGDTNGALDVFVHDRQAGATERVSVTSDGQQGTSPQGIWYTGGTHVGLSADGRYVAFLSKHTNLVTPDLNGPSDDVFVRDRLLGTTTRVSESSDGLQADTFSGSVSISADGRFVAFVTFAGNLVPDDSGCLDVFVHDRDGHLTERVSVQSGGAPKVGYTDTARISGDGRFVAFYSFSSNLVAGDTNAEEDLFVHDRLTHVTERASLSATGAQTAGGRTSWSSAAINGDGSVVAFESTAGDVVTGDTNGAEDVFVRTLAHCAITVSPSYAIVSSSGGTPQFSISTTPAGCAWAPSAAEALPWGSATWLTPGPGATGDGTLRLSVAQNAWGSTRHARVFVHGTQVTIAQDGSSTGCALLVTGVPASVPGQGGVVTFDAASGCSYGLTSLVPWIAASRIAGSSRVQLSVARNPGPTARSGVVLVGATAHVITQPLNDCPATVSSTRITLPGDGGSTPVTIEGTAGCPWQATTPASWLTVTGDGAGSGMATLTAAPNPGAVARSTAVSVAGVTLAVVQLGSTGSLTGWLPYLNAYRATAGLLPVTASTEWSAGGMLHSRYVVRTGSVGHTEDPLHPDYTPEGAAAGANGNVASLWTVDAPDTEAIDMWMAAPFHALAMLHPRLAVSGFGSYREGNRTLTTAATLDVHRGVSRAPAAGDYPVMWPANGATVPLTTYAGNENPDPLSACPGYSNSTSGLPLLLSLGPEAAVPAVDASSVTGAAGPLPHCVITETTYVYPSYQPTQDLGRASLRAQHSIILIPRGPLEFGQSYTASVTANGTTHQWTFSIGQLPGVSCLPVVSSVLGPTLSSNAQYVSIDVAVPSGCPWSLSSAPGWMQGTVTPGRGRGRFSLYAAANTGPTRTGTIAVGGSTVTVRQLGADDENDTDGDGLPDGWERQFGLSTSDATGANGRDGDPDGDGVTNIAEYTNQTHPRGTITRYLAEGSTQSIFDTRIALANPGSSPVAAWLRFMRPDGGAVVTRLVTLAAHQRATVIASQVDGLQATAFATQIEADGMVAIDRTVSWDATGYGAHTETAVEAPNATWYLAEGSTVGGFNLFYLLQNPGNETADVRVRYLLPSGTPLEKSYRLPPSSRTNIWVNHEEFEGLGAALASTDVSAVIEVTDGPPIIVERALYLDAPSQVFAAGHESAGVTAPATQWFLAEGATGPFFDLFVLIANPTATEARIEARYLLPDGTAFSTEHVVGANSRANIWVDYDDERLADTAVSTTIRSLDGVPVIVERALWWPATWYEAHNSPGATTTGAAWVLAEGEVGGPRNVETYILIANTSAQPGTARVTLLLEDGGTLERTYAAIPGSSRFNVDVRSDFPQAAGKRFGALVESIGTTPAQLVVERAMYWDAAGQWWAAGTNAAATRLQ